MEVEIEGEEVVEESLSVENAVKQRERNYDP